MILNSVCSLVGSDWEKSKHFPDQIKAEHSLGVGRGVFNLSNIDQVLWYLVQDDQYDGARDGEQEIRYDQNNEIMDHKRLK